MEPTFPPGAAQRSGEDDDPVRLTFSADHLAVLAVGFSRHVRTMSLSSTPLFFLSAILRVLYLTRRIHSNDMVWIYSTFSCC